MHIVATVTTDAASIHDALDVIISLHAVLMRRTVGEMSERLLAEFVVFQFPEILEIPSGTEADRPVIIHAADWVAERLSLRMALNANIGGLYHVQASGVHDVRR